MAQHPHVSPLEIVRGDTFSFVRIWGAFGSVNEMGFTIARGIKQRKAINRLIITAAPR